MTLSQVFCDFSVVIGVISGVISILGLLRFLTWFSPVTQLGRLEAVWREVEGLRCSSSLQSTSGDATVRPADDMETQVAACCGLKLEVEKYRARVFSSRGSWGSSTQHPGMLSIDLFFAVRRAKELRSTLSARVGTFLALTEVSATCHPVTDTEEASSVIRNSLDIRPWPQFPQHSLLPVQTATLVHHIEASRRGNETLSEPLATSISSVHHGRHNLDVPTSPVNLVTAALPAEEVLVGSLSPPSPNLRVFDTAEEAGSPPIVQGDIGVDFDERSDGTTDRADRPAKLIMAPSGRRPLRQIDEIRDFLARSSNRKRAPFHRGIALRLRIARHTATFDSETLGERLCVQTP